MGMGLTRWWALNVSMASSNVASSLRVRGSEFMMSFTVSSEISLVPILGGSSFFSAYMSVIIFWRNEAFIDEVWVIRSYSVIMPTSLLFLSMTGTPSKLCSVMILVASVMGVSGETDMTFLVMTSLRYIFFI